MLQRVNVLDNMYLIICLTLIIVSVLVVIVFLFVLVCFSHNYIANPLISCKKKLIRKVSADCCEHTARV